MRNFFILLATIILGIGHIGIHLSHKKEVLNDEKKKGIISRIFRVALMVVFVIVFGVIAIIIGARNYNAIRGCIHSSNGIEEEYRHRGYAKELLLECEKWAKEKHCTEFASDCEIDNDVSFGFHLSMGFEEANRIICFRKDI